MQVIWVQDYHLLLLPQMLRTSLPSAKIGFFLHVPFPSSELYRIMPQREEFLVRKILAHLLGNKIGRMIPQRGEECISTPCGALFYFLFFTF